MKKPKISILIFDVILNSSRTTSFLSYGTVFAIVVINGSRSNYLHRSALPVR